MLANHDQNNESRFSKFICYSLNRAERRNLLCKITKLDRSKVRLNRSRILSAKFELSPNSSSSPLQIKVSDLLLLVYKGNPKYVFIRALEREIRVHLVPLL